MKNRFLRRGLILLIAGIALNLAGYFLKENNNDYFGWLMIAGVISFGIGFISIFYSLIRKVEAKGIMEDRAEEKERKRRFWMESRKSKQAVQV